MTVLEMIGVFWLLFGAFFYLTGVVSIIRMPDAYSRLNASGKVTTLGLFGVAIGVGFLQPESVFKLIALVFFVGLTTPVASHAIANADKTYSERQQIARDSSISAAGQQDNIQSTQEQKIVSPESEPA